MRKPGRPHGSGYDDAAAIRKVLALMQDEGGTRRSAIIRVCGHDQLRRVEMKMAALGVVRNAKVRVMTSGNEWGHGHRIGVDDDGVTVFLGPRDLGGSMLTYGTTGSNKTEFLLDLATSMVASGSGLIYIDGWGDYCLPHRLKTIAASLGRGDDILHADLVMPVPGQKGRSLDAFIGECSDAQDRMRDQLADAVLNRRILLVSLPGLDAASDKLELAGMRIGAAIKAMMMGLLRRDAIDVPFDGMLETRRPSAPVCPIVLDEFGHYMVSDDMSLCASQARGLGLCFVIGAQDVQRIRHRNVRAAEDLISLCHTRIELGTSGEIDLTQGKVSRRIRSIDRHA